MNVCHRIVSHLILVVLVGVMCPPVQAQELHENQKLHTPEAYKDDRFGQSICISGNTAIIGAPSPGNSSTIGAAYVFYQNQDLAGEWELVTKLTTDGYVYELFGHSVSISGDYAIVGAYMDSENGLSSGSAYVFYRNEGGPDSWGQVAKLLASDGAMDDYFGRSVSISGDYAIVGAPLNDDTYVNTGSAYVFYRHEGGIDAWGQVAKINHPDVAARDSFGNAVSLSGDYALIGMWGDNDQGTGSGSAYIYHRNSSSEEWEQIAKLKAADGAAGYGFSHSVSLSGDYALIGSAGADSGLGAAYVFYRYQGGGDAWGEMAKLTASDRDLEFFGSSVSISGDYAVVGASLDDDEGMNTGSAYVFHRDNGGTDAWDQVAKVRATDGTEEDRFGYGVSVFGDYAIIGAFLDDEYGDNSGSAYVIHVASLNPNAITQTAASSPQRCMLSPNVPNPFNPTTSIRFSIPASDHLTLRIYTPTGQLVREMLNETVSAGYHERMWDGRSSDGRSVGSGVYIYEMRTSDERIVRRMTLLR
jgi:hypothetical protein